jgi:hypothetical protein
MYEKSLNTAIEIVNFKEKKLMAKQRLLDCHWDAKEEWKMPPFH